MTEEINVYEKENWCVIDNTRNDEIMSYKMLTGEFPPRKLNEIGSAQWVL